MADGRLKEVEEAAVRIQTKRFNDFFEEQAYQAEKRNEQTPKQEDETPKAGKDIK